jgi:hypothetical protein
MCTGPARSGLLLVLALGTWGLTVIGTIFSALTVNIRLREVMLPMLVYPMLMPALMSAMQLTMLRHAVEEPTQRATFAAVWSIFSFIDVPIVIFSIKWWRTQHPQPVFWGGGSFPHEWLIVWLWNILAMMLLGAVMTVVRVRQEDTQRELDSLRRTAHAM